MFVLLDADLAVGATLLEPPGPLSMKRPVSSTASRSEPPPLLRRSIRRPSTFSFFVRRSGGPRRGWRCGNLVAFAAAFESS